MEFNDWDVDGYRYRIRLLRRLLNMNQTQFSEWTGIPYKKWNHYERGYPISRETAFALRKKIDWFSTDWLWHGDTRALASGTLDQIHAIEQDDRERRQHLKPSKPLPMTEVRKKLGKRRK